MAGGVGSRFWPLSKSSRPKQFLDILGTGKTFLRQTFERFLPLCPATNILVVTSSQYGALVAEQLPELPAENILVEPGRRNTAPCVAYANEKIRRVSPEALVVVTPADHLVLDETRFRQELERGFHFVAEKPALLTLGMKPNRPETGYGYIQVPDWHEFGQIDKVKTFTEKPDVEMAKVFFQSGDFYWNAGIFIWSLSAIDQAFRQHLPDLHALFEAERESFGTADEPAAIRRVYAESPSISIDYGVMEKADEVYVLTTDFGWSDLGTWGSLHENSEKDGKGNAVMAGRSLLYEVSDSVFRLQGGRLLVAQGLEGFIVAESDGVLLICKKDQEQRIREFVSDVKLKVGEEFI